MLDQYLIGDYHRNSPEAEVPVINHINKENRLGGAANVALNLASIDITPVLVSIIGEDTDGEILRELCTEKGIANHFIKVPKRTTTKKQRIVDQDFKQYLRVDFEKTDDISKEIENQIIDHITEIAEHGDVQGLVIQDYNKGLLTPRLISVILDFCKENGLPTFADPKHQNFKLLAHATVFKPNLKELSVYLDKEQQSELDVLSDTIKASPTLNLCDFLFVTLGAKGIYYKDFINQEEGIVNGKPVIEPDVSGAGDTVLAALVMAYLANPAAKSMAELANHAGAIVCSKKGVSRITTKEISQKS